MPQALHEDLVFLGHSRNLGEGLRYRFACLLVEIEEKIVEEGKLVMDRHVGFADLLVKLFQCAVGLRRVNLCCKRKRLDIARKVPKPVHTLRNAHRPQNAINEEDSIEAFATSLNVVLDISIIRV